MVEAKICGITTPEALDAALAGGARFVGFVLHADSPRLVGLEAARALFERVAGRAETVAVISNAPSERLRTLSATLKPDWIQAHGNETAAELASLRTLARKGVIKAIGIARSEDFEAVAGFAEAADMLLFDAKPPPGARRSGGHGLAFDWAMLAGRRFPRPWLLSGGLTPLNVGEAIAASGAGFVDVSSGVESAPGLKDPSKVAEFLAAIRA
jgi:phosphoribosylanthranilate isomerase